MSRSYVTNQISKVHLFYPPANRYETERVALIKHIFKSIVYTHWPIIIMHKMILSY